MTQEHPITPPPELVQQWLGDYFGCVVNGELSDSEKFLANQAAEWGANQELEACLNQIYKGVGLRVIDYGSDRELLCSDLRAARRPKPPTLKEQALEALDEEQADMSIQNYKVIRSVLESLPD